MKLDLSKRGLTTLQGIYFPDNVTELIIHGNLLTSLEHCPQNIKILYCSNNQLTSLQGCPENLQELDCRSNQLISLQGCPESLHELNCGENQLTSLQYCPKNLKILFCESNQLTSLQYCPQSLQYLECSYNQITSLQYCPESLKILWKYDNPLSPEYQDKTLKQIKLINYIKRFQRGLDIVNNQINNQKVIVIQRYWDNYWYKPNEQGISRQVITMNSNNRTRWNPDNRH